MKGLLVVLLIAVVLALSACASSITQEIEPGVIAPIGVGSGIRLTFYHDEVHGVGIWVITGSGNHLFVLPDSQYKNHELPMKP